MALFVFLICVNTHLCSKINISFQGFVFHYYDVIDMQPRLIPTTADFITVQDPFNHFGYHQGLERQYLRFVLVFEEPGAGRGMQQWNSRVAINMNRCELTSMIN